VDRFQPSEQGPIGSPIDVSTQVGTHLRGILVESLCEQSILKFVDCHAGELTSFSVEALINYAGYSQ
jgi:hypothetical protein